MCFQYDHVSNRKNQSGVLSENKAAVQAEISTAVCGVSVKKLLANQ